MGLSCFVPKPFVSMRAVRISDFYHTIIVAEGINNSDYNNMLPIKSVWNSVFCLFFWQMHYLQNMSVGKWRESVNITVKKKKKLKMKRHPDELVTKRCTRLKMFCGWSFSNLNICLRLGQTI